MMGGVTNPAGSYGYAAGMPGPFGSPNLVRQYLPDPDREKALKLQEQGQNFQEDLARAKFGFSQDVFKSLSPFLNSSLSGRAPGGTGTAPPGIHTNPIYSPEQIAQQVNAQTAANDQRTATMKRMLGNSAAGRGFGMASPAIQAQMNTLGIANMGANAQAAREVPMQYMQANADQGFRTDQLANQQWGMGEDFDIRRRQSQLQVLNSLLGFAG